MDDKRGEGRRCLGSERRRSGRRGDIRSVDDVVGKDRVVRLGTNTLDPQRSPRILLSEDLKDRKTSSHSVVWWTQNTKCFSFK